MNFQMNMFRSLTQSECRIIIILFSNSINHEKCIIFSPSAGRLESFRMNTINGRFESKIAVTFILISGEKMDAFLKSMYF